MQVSRTPFRRCVLALEVRPRIIAFAVFGSPNDLMDYGTRKHRVAATDLPTVAKMKITALLDSHLPSVIATRMRTIRSAKARRRITTILRVVQAEAKERSAEFEAIGAKAIHRFFAQHQCRSKQQMATLIAHWLPELSWRLPPNRRIWKSEDHRMMIFDAAATALAFLNKSPPQTRQ